MCRASAAEKTSPEYHLLIVSASPHKLITTDVKGRDLKGRLESQGQKESWRLRGQSLNRFEGTLRDVKRPGLGVTSAVYASCEKVRA